ncbi:uncharacterized protein BJ212DRAFT_1304213 [Suillus subaureus]|uniref:Uncharacterized protein n=1 Tax=Suillus subaureus TaxID=48587 RepID=A0A9P7DWD1_9AGAM|nr:uncharacterized protein BJ212DRAFT_1304213 [Suillus subaureus]KAG1804662.1 hypothetical protein BJ212DRAFT_1304213 [Suillus subaureus]
MHITSAALASDIQYTHMYLPMLILWYRNSKGQIYNVIAKLIFTGHPKYGQAYQHNQKKFRDAVSNHITKSKYKKLKAQFSEMGAGVMPLDGMASNSVLMELLWYMELDAIWHANPSIAAKTHSSKPSVDHAATLYSLVKPHGAGPLIGAHNTPPPTTHPPVVPPAAHPYGDPPINPQLCQAAPAPAPPAPPPVHLHSLNSPDVEIKDDFIPPSPNNLERSPFNIPLRDALNHFDDDDNMMYDSTGTFNSPP